MYFIWWLHDSSLSVGLMLSASHDGIHIHDYIYIYIYNNVIYILFVFIHQLLHCILLCLNKGIF